MATNICREGETESEKNDLTTAQNKQPVLTNLLGLLKRQRKASDFVLALRLAGSGGHCEIFPTQGLPTSKSSWAADQELSGYVAIVFRVFFTLSPKAEPG